MATATLREHCFAPGPSISVIPFAYLCLTSPTQPQFFKKSQILLVKPFTQPANKKGPTSFPAGPKEVSQPQGEANQQLLAALLNQVYTPAPIATTPVFLHREPQMLEHLVQFEPEITSRDGFVKLENVSSEDLLAAQVNTDAWLRSLGVATDEEIAQDKEKEAAREAFGALTTTADDLETKEKLVALKTPAAVRHLTGMLTAYDWEFVQQAKEIRGYTVAQLLEETKNPNANIRLKALGLLGKVTEVGLFTEKVEIKKTDLTEEEVEAKLKEKLAKFMGVVDADYTDVEEKLQITNDNQPAADA